MKPNSEPMHEVKLGDAFIPEFYIVAVIPPGLITQFAICASGGVETSSSEQDGIFPCIGVSEEKANQQYKKIAEQMHDQGIPGTLILVKLTGGVIQKLMEFDGPNGLEVVLVQ